MMLYSDQKKNDVPTGGKWYLDAGMAHAEYLKDPSQFLLMLNPPNCYALYPTASAFTYNLPDSKPINQRAYEIIPMNAPCKAYANLVFKSQADLHEILAHYKRKAMREYGVDPLFEISDFTDCSARIIISNMPLSNNHNGQMQGFFTSEDKLFSIDEDIYSLGHRRQISITDQQDPDHIARFLVTNPAVPVLHQQHAEIKTNTTPVMMPHYKSGEYCIVNNKELVVDPSGNADLLQRYDDFVRGQFNHAPLGLNAEQDEEVSAIENEAIQKYTIRGSPTMISQPYTRLDLIIHTLYDTDALSLQLYPMLAALAIVSQSHPSSAPDILYALMTVFRHDEQRLAMIYHMFTYFRFDSCTPANEVCHHQTYMFAPPNQDTFILRYAADAG